MKLTEAKDKYLRDHKLKGSTQKTVTGYSDVLTAFIKHVGNIDLEDLDIELIRDYQESLFDRNLSKASIASYLRHLKAFVHYLEENNYIENEEMFKKIKLPRKSKRVVDLFTPTEMNLIFDNITGTPEWIRLRNCLIVALMYDSGLRQSELCNIVKEDLNISASILKIHGKGDKERFVPLGKTTKEMICEYLEACPHESNYLLVASNGNQLTPNTVKLFITKLREKVEIPNLTSHKLRHNFATNYVLDMYREQGFVDLYKLSAILGHEDMETTKIYLHIASQMIATSGHISYLDYIKEITEKR